MLTGDIKLEMLKKSQKSKIKKQNMSLLIKKFRIKSFKEEKPEIEIKNLTITYGNRQVIENLKLKNSTK